MTSQPSAAGDTLAIMRETASSATLVPPPPLRGGFDLLDRMAKARSPDQLSALLARTLEQAVIPRLALTRRDAAAPAHGAAPTGAEIEQLTGIVMRGDLPAALALVAALRGRDVPLERILLEVLTPVAHTLGEMWLADRCDFSTVTIGVCCLQQVVLEQHDAAAPRRVEPDAERRILLAPVPGEQHSFGLVIVAELFRRQGWEVSSASGASAREIVALARRQHFGVVGFSLADEERLPVLATLIHDIRRASRNPRLGVLVGGHAFLDRPDLVARVGADATAQDGQQAVLKAETLLALMLQDA
jgi:methanogenic corrinoid protein MtbC1